MATRSAVRQRMFLRRVEEALPRASASAIQTFMRDGFRLRCRALLPLLCCATFAVCYLLRRCLRAQMTRDAAYFVAAAFSYALLMRAIDAATPVIAYAALSLLARYICYALFYAIDIETERKMAFYDAAPAATPARNVYARVRDASFAAACARHVAFCRPPSPTR